MSSRRQHTLALIITLLFHAAVIAGIMAIYLRYNPADTAEREWPPVDSSEILFGGEYVITGDIPDASDSDEPAPAEEDEAPAADEPAPAADPESAPNPAPATKTPAPVSKTPSSVKSTDQPVKTQSDRQKQEEAAAEEARRNQQISDEIGSRVKFGGQQGSGQGKQGSPNGNSDTGKTSGQPGVNLGGRTLASWQTPRSAPMGTITISVSVDRQGNVKSAAYQSGTGAAAASTAAREECRRAALASKFSVDLNAPAAQRGTITYHFR